MLELPRRAESRQRAAHPPRASFHFECYHKSHTYYMQLEEEKRRRFFGQADHMFQGHSVSMTCITACPYETFCALMMPRAHHCPALHYLNKVSPRLSILVPVGRRISCHNLKQRNGPRVPCSPHTSTKKISKRQ